jgi:hypothetical protein
LGHIGNAPCSSAHVTSECKFVDEHGITVRVVGYGDAAADSTVKESCEKHGGDLTVTRR